jgi:hypothetical protein
LTHPTQKSNASFANQKSKAKEKYSKKNKKMIGDATCKLRKSKEENEDRRWRKKKTSNLAHLLMIIVQDPERLRGEIAAEKKQKRDGLSRLE